MQLAWITSKVIPLTCLWSSLRRQVRSAFSNYRQRSVEGNKKKRIWWSATHRVSNRLMTSWTVILYHYTHKLKMASARDAPRNVVAEVVEAENQSLRLQFLLSRSLAQRKTKIKTLSRAWLWRASKMLLPGAKLTSNISIRRRLISSAKTLLLTNSDSISQSVRHHKTVWICQWIIRSAQQGQETFVWQPTVLTCAKKAQVSITQITNVSRQMQRLEPPQILQIGLVTLTLAWAAALNCTRDCPLSTRNLTTLRTRSKAWWMSHLTTSTGLVRLNQAHSDLAKTFQSLNRRRKQTLKVRLRTWKYHRLSLWWAQFVLAVPASSSSVEASPMALV